MDAVTPYRQLPDPMNRITQDLWPLNPLLDGIQSGRPVEALLVWRAGLVEILRDHLFELHNLRQRALGTPAEADWAQRIKYWDEVLGWLKQRQGEDVIINDRTNMSKH